MMDMADKAAFLKIHLVIKYILDTKNLGLWIELKGNENKMWELICFSNKNYTCDLIMRRSRSGFVLY